MKRKLIAIFTILIAVISCMAILVGCGETQQETPKQDEADNFPAFTFILTSDSTAYSVKAASKSAVSGEITIPDTINGKPVTAIAAKGFSGTSITKISLPSTLEKVGTSAFSDCGELTEITFPSSVTTISKNAFNACTALTSVTFENSVQTIGENAFMDCSSLEIITFNDGLTTIGDYAFKNCTALKNVKFPETLTSIGSESFAQCTTLTSVKIPASVQSIGDYCFGYNNGSQYPGSLIEAYFYGNVPSGVNQSFGYTWDADEFIVYVPTEYLTAYETADAYDWNRCVVKLGKLKSFNPTEKPYNE